MFVLPAEKIREQTDEDRVTPQSYRLPHAEARPREDDKRIPLRWAGR